VLSPMAASPATEKIRNRMGYVQNIFSAVLDATLEIPMFGVVAPLVLAFLWLLLLRFFAKTVTYFMIGFLGFACLAFSIYCFYQSGDIQGYVDDVLANSTALSASNASGADAALWANDTYAAVLGLASYTQASLVSLVPTVTEETHSEQSSSDPTLWRIAGACALVVASSYFVMMCIARRRIARAVSLVKEATLVVADRPTLMLFPVNTASVQVAIMFYFVLIAAFLSTADINSSTFTSSNLGSAASTFADQIAFYNSTITSDGMSGFAELDDSSQIKSFLYLYMVFGFVWTFLFIEAVGWTALSGSVCHWYFFRKDDDSATRWPLTRSLQRVLRYHLGTIAAGSLIVAIVKFIRLGLMSLDAALKKGKENSRLLRLIFRCVACCLWCLEKTLMYITSYCYVYVAMTGSGFCLSCFSTFNLIVQYPLQLTINAFVRMILNLVQLISVPLVCGWACNYVLWRQDKKEPVYATLIVVIAAFVITKVCAGVFSCVLDTLFVCCTRDMAEYNGQWMSARLRTAFDFDRKVGKKKKGKKGKKAEGGATEGDATEGGEPAPEA